MMAEQGQAGEVYAPTRTIQVWKALLNWLAFFFQIFLQIIRATPSVASILSSSPPSPTPSFKPLPSVELPELHDSDLPSASSVDDDQLFSEKLTPCVVTANEMLSSPKVRKVFVNTYLGLIILHLLIDKGKPCKEFISLFSDQFTCLYTERWTNLQCWMPVIDHCKQKKTKVVLDLDETLICAYDTSSLPAIIRTQATEAGLKWFELECVSSDKEFEGKPKVNYVTVFERPGLHEFLRQLSEFADLVLFTAGLEGYARPLVDRIDSENLFGRRLYRPSTSSTEFREHVKDLSCISTDFCRIVLVDNNPFSFLLQPLNGIPCIPFSGGQPHDEQLLEVLLPLLKHLSRQKDVRPVLNERFHMPEWFQKHGIPTSCWTT